MTALEELRFVARADVYKAGVAAATLTKAGGVVELRYRPGYLARADAIPLATSLPLGPDPVVGHAGALPPFFAGLLPEGRRLSVLWRALKTSVDDELSLLLAVGHDTVGDVQVVPEGAEPREAPPGVVVEDWAGVRFSDLVARSVGDGRREIDPAAIPGVQAKLSGRVLSLPVAGPAEQWILKLNPPEYPYVVENEAFFLGAARSAGLAVADAEVVTDRDDDRGLLVRRFDRVVEGGLVRRLAQEDAAQILGRYPADKYNLSTEAVVDALVACTRARPVAARDLFRQLVFAYLSGDGDVHAKNLSVGETVSGEWQVTPAYDLPSTRPYGDTTLALRVGGRTDGIGRRRWLALADHIGLRERAASSVLDHLTDHAASWIDRLDELPFDEGRIRALRRLARNRRDQLARRSG